MLYLALSCLQGQGQWEAAQELLTYQPDGLQLTPGNKPDCLPSAFDGIRTNRHQGHSFTQTVAKIWDGSTLSWDYGSVHARLDWQTQAQLHPEMVWETMYPKSGANHGLLTSNDYADAMLHATPVALDLSHADIAIAAGLLNRSTVEALLVYGNVRELHISGNDGRSDTHSPLRASYPWLSVVEAWSDTHPDRPVVLECYFHKLTPTQRHVQVDLFQGCRAVV